MRSFGSDNHSGIHVDVLDAIHRANEEHAAAYGGDPWTRTALSLFQEQFGSDAETFFVLTGTGANLLALSPILRSYQSVLCSSFSHIAFDECGGPETFTGSKLVAIEAENAKLTPQLVKRHLDRIGDVHAAQPRVLSITQPTEYGSVYRVEEIRALSEFARSHGLLVHMDGARLANACVTLELGLRETTRDLGIDVLSFGGTKNGLMCGEAVVFFTPEAAESARFYRKKLAQLPSKMRFIAAQFEAYLTNDLWRANAANANAMARLLAESVSGIPGIRLSRPVDANMIFAIVESRLLSELQKEFLFYVIDQSAGEVRWVTSFDTRPGDIEVFAAAARRAAAGA